MSTSYNLRYLEITIHGTTGESTLNSTAVHHHVLVTSQSPFTLPERSFVRRNWQLRTRISLHGDPRSLWMTYVTTHIDACQKQRWKVLGSTPVTRWTDSEVFSKIPQPSLLWGVLASPWMRSHLSALCSTRAWTQMLGQQGSPSTQQSEGKGWRVPGDSNPDHSREDDGSLRRIRFLCLTMSIRGLPDSRARISSE